MYGLMVWREVKFGRDGVIEGVTGKALSNSKTLKYCNIYSEIRNSATLISAALNRATWRNATSNCEN